VAATHTWILAQIGVQPSRVDGAVDNHVSVVVDRQGPWRRGPLRSTPGRGGRRGRLDFDGPGRSQQTNQAPSLPRDGRLNPQCIELVHVEQLEVVGKLLHVVFFGFLLRGQQR
jgi:hypothetical protein